MISLAKLRDAEREQKVRRSREITRNWENTARALRERYSRRSFFLFERAPMKFASLGAKYSPIRASPAAMPRISNLVLNFPAYSWNLGDSRASRVISVKTCRGRDQEETRELIVAWDGNLNVGFLPNYNDSVAVPGSPPRAASTIRMETVGMSTVTKTHRYQNFKYLQPI